MWVVMCVPCAAAFTAGVLAWDRGKRRDAVVYMIASAVWFIAAVMA